MENYDKMPFTGRKTVDNPVETVNNMLHIRGFIQKLQNFYKIRFLFLVEKIGAENCNVNRTSAKRSE